MSFFHWNPFGKSAKVELIAYRHEILKYKMIKYLLLYILILPFSTSAQQAIQINDILCGMEGSAKRAGDKTLNRFKNRYTLPRENDFDARFNWEEFLKDEDDRKKFSNENAAILRGYVYRIKEGSVETCNCNAKDPYFQDTHIILTPNADKTDALLQVVIEVTPRLRLLMREKGIDWSHEALKKLRGKKVEIQGWLFYDYRHGENSAKIRKTGKITRSTAWEIHPVTQITVLK